MLFYCQLLLNFQGSYIDFYVRSFSILEKTLERVKEHKLVHKNGKSREDIV